MTWLNTGWLGDNNQGGSSSGGSVTPNDINKLQSQITTLNTEIQDTIESVTDINNNQLELENTINAHIEDKNNPHDVTSEQIGASVIESNINPNLLYNSTGMVGLTGWLGAISKAEVYRDEFILDDNSYFILKGNNESDGFVSNSFPVTPGKSYTFSGLFKTDKNSSFKIIFGYQDINNLNDITSTLNDNELVITENEWTSKFITSIAPENAHSGYIRILTTNGNNYLKRMKVEEGTVITKWIPSLTDPFETSNTVLVGYDAKDMINETY